jgi:ADYC domain-containing protein
MMNRACLSLAVALVAASIPFAPSPARAGLCSYCGSNAATVGDGVVFDELNVNHERNPGGPRIVSATLKNGTPVTLQVIGDELTAITTGKIGAGKQHVKGRPEPMRSLKHQTYRGGKLQGMTISLDMESGDAYVITLANLVDEMTFWTDPQYQKVWSYDFTVEKLDPKTGAPVHNITASVLPPRHVCEGKFAEPNSPVTPIPDALHTAIVFTGDHYDAFHKVGPQAPGWFNLACFGTAAAKMHLIRHTQVGAARAANGPIPTFDQRTAMLRAITADYCGDGRSWTADGTPLWWTDEGQRLPLNIQPDFTKTMQSWTPDVSGQDVFGKNVEGVWGQDGELLCLNEPRRRPHGTNKKTCSVPAVERAEVTTGREACRGRSIPPCDQFPWSYTGTGSPWASSPLNGRYVSPRGPLSSAYVVTVNRPGPRDYCGAAVWPPPSH